MSPLFSVIIPVFNKGDLLRQALRSVSEQSFQDFEVIVVDDASTDNSLHCLCEFSSLNILLLRRELPGPGGYAARNLAIKHSKGQWITFLDADDLWFSNHLSTVAKVIQQDHQFAFICTAFMEISPHNVKQVGFDCDSRFTASSFLDLYSKRDLIHTNSIIVGRNYLFDAGGFPEQNVFRGGDHALWLRLVLLGHPIFLISDVTTCYRIEHSGVVSNPKTLRGAHPVVDVVESVLSGKLSIPSSWDKKEIRLLKNLANRKSLLWMTNRRSFGALPIHSMTVPYPFSMTPMNLVRWIANILIPRILLNKLIALKHKIGS